MTVMIPEMLLMMRINCVSAKRSKSVSQKLHRNLTSVEFIVNAQRRILAGIWKNMLIYYFVCARKQRESIRVLERNIRLQFLYIYAYTYLRHSATSFHVFIHSVMHIFLSHFGHFHASKDILLHRDLVAGNTSMRKCRSSVGLGEQTMCRTRERTREPRYQSAW